MSHTLLSRARAAALRAPTLLALVVAIPMAAADLTDVQFHGFVSQGYLLTTSNNYLGDTKDQGTFEFNEFALNALARPIDRLRVGIQLFARDLALYGNDEVIIDWAYADYQAVQADWGSVGVQVGRFKTVYGLYNEIRDVDMARTQVFLPTTVYNNRLRDVYLAINGVGAYGGLKMGKAGSLDWTAQVGATQLDEDGDLAQSFVSLGLFGEVNSFGSDGTGGGSVTWNTPLDGLRFRISAIDVRNVNAVGTPGATATSAAAAGLTTGINAGLASINANPVDPLDSSAIIFSPVTFQADNYYTGVASAEYQIGNLTLAGEWMREYAKFNVTGEADYNVGYLNTTINAANPGGATPPFGPPIAPGQVGPAVTGALPPIPNTTRVQYQRLEGFYASAAYRFLDKWEIAGGPQVAFSNYQDRGSGTEHRGWSLALRYDIFSNWLVKAEWQSIRGTGQLYASENPEGIDYTWNMFALKTTVDF